MRKNTYRAFFALLALAALIFAASCSKSDDSAPVCDCIEKNYYLVGGSWQDSAIYTYEIEGCGEETTTYEQQGSFLVETKCTPRQN